MGRGSYSGGSTIIHIWPKRSPKSGIGLNRGLLQTELEGVHTFVPRTYVIPADEAKKAKQEKTKSRVKIGTTSQKSIKSVKPAKLKAAVSVFSPGEVAARHRGKSFSVPVVVKHSSKKGKE